jgi:hypothetical protein
MMQGMLANMLLSMQTMMEQTLQQVLKQGMTPLTKTIMNDMGIDPDDLLEDMRKEGILQEALMPLERQLIVAHMPILDFPDRMLKHVMGRVLSQRRVTLNKRVIIIISNHGLAEAVQLALLLACIKEVTGNKE